MATRKLEAEFMNLKKEFIRLQNLIQNLPDKQRDLEKKYENFLLKQRKTNSKCRKCGDKFQVLGQLQKHKEEGCSSEKLKCDECDKCFKDEQKLKEHKESKHTRFECDCCDKEFKYEALLEKHKEAAHENVELYCHYFNNGKDCPFEDECIFLHEESVNCRFGKNCERNLCMYQHGGFDAVENDDDAISDDDYDEDDDDQIEIGNVNLEHIKPVLDKFKEAVENFEKLLGQYSLKCKDCEFEGKDLNGLTMHIKAEHNK